MDWLFNNGFLLVEGIIGDESFADVGVIFNLEVTEHDDEDDESDDTNDNACADADDGSKRRGLRVRC